MCQKFKLTACVGLISLLATLSGCIHEKMEGSFEGANIQAGDRLPDFSILMNEGTTLHSESLEGKVSVIMLFTVTCPQCQDQLPTVEALYKEYGSQENIVFLGISREQGEELVGKYWRDKSYTLPYSAQESREVYSLFATSIVPRIYVSDRKRIVQAVFTDRPLVTYAQLKETIESVWHENEPE